MTDCFTEGGSSVPSLSQKRDTCSTCSSFSSLLALFFPLQSDFIWSEMERMCWLLITVISPKCQRSFDYIRSH